MLSGMFTVRLYRLCVQVLYTNNGKAQKSELSSAETKPIKEALLKNVANE